MSANTTLRMRRSYHAPARAVFDDIEPPTRLAFTWIWDGDGTRQLIEIDFDETDGITTVSFTHSGLWDEQAVRSHEDGWRKCFDNLDHTLDGAWGAGTTSR